MKITSFARISTLSLLALAAINLSACTNTVRGAGQDVENAGEAVQDATR
jgi:predicted small secreted protein